MKNIKSLFGLKNKKGINDKILTDIRTLYESDKEGYYKTIRIGNALRNDYTEYESNGDKDKILFIDDYLDMVNF